MSAASLAASTTVVGGNCAGSAEQMETVMRITTRIILGAAVVGVLCISSLHAAPFTVVKVADTSTAIPGSTGNFDNFHTNSRVSTDGATIVFTGSNSSFQTGVYSYSMASHTLARVADWTTFTNLSEPSVYGGTVGFKGSTSGQTGIYTASTTGAGLTTIADLSTAIPDTGTPGIQFQAFDAPTLQGGNLAFYSNGAGNSFAGVYTVPTAGGTITKIADNNTARPGAGTNFNQFGRVSIGGSSVAFLGGYSTGILSEGIYSAPVAGGTVTRVVAAGMVAPGLGAATFTTPYFSSPSTDGTYVAFNASTLASGACTGLWQYKIDGTDGKLVAGLNTFIPGHDTTKFDSFWGVSIFDGVAIFNGTSNIGVGGIYAHTAYDTLITIIESGDAIGGKTILSAHVYDQSFIGDIDVIAFYATFTDGSSGIYAAQVPEEVLGAPEPATLSLLALGAMALLKRRRK